MQLPSLDRTPPLRPYNADVASASAVRIATKAASENTPAPGSVPVPVHSPGSVRSAEAIQSTTHAQAATAIEPTPSVINMVGMSNKATSGDAVYSSVPDPTRRSPESATAPKDWTIHRAEPEKEEFPAPVPIYKVLIDHIKSMWTASASAVQVEQVKNQLEVPQKNPDATPGVLATEVLTYSPTKINKTEKM
jgi:hypothetical protein